MIDASSLRRQAATKALTGRANARMAAAFVPQAFQRAAADVQQAGAAVAPRGPSMADALGPMPAPGPAPYQKGGSVFSGISDYAGVFPAPAPIDSSSHKKQPQKRLVNQDTGTY